MSKLDVHFSTGDKGGKGTTEWGTPAYLFTHLNAQFFFAVDVCATSDNTKCTAFYSKQLEPSSSGSDGLQQLWPENCAVWCNPPYGRGLITPWIKKAVLEAERANVTTVFLLPARTDVAWFHDYIYNKPDVSWEFLRGRIQFVAANCKNKAPFPSMIAVFWGAETQIRAFTVPNQHR
jgi:phage N-6-adenine-methyltransferase